ncbi:MAG: lamin tail domain-containing protein [Acidobacteria bacterium]|nr:lamin tail domain-containing protein [Acidobacteriota bacterium]
MGWTLRGSSLRVAVGCMLALGATSAGFGQIVINEIMYDPSVSGDVNAEWFELYNAGSADVDINGWIIKDDQTTNERHTINNGGPLSIGAGKYLVLGRNSNKAANGNVTVNYVYATVGLSNGTDGLILENPDAVTPEQDKVVWGTANGFPDPSNSASIALKFKKNSNPLDNLQGENWCTSTTPIPGGVDAGTPGAENSDCEITPPFTGSIGGIQGTGAISPHVRAESVTTNNNIVTAVGAGGFFMQSPGTGDGNPDTSDGIFVAHTDSPTVSVGDRVDVSGTVEEYFGFTRFASGATVTLDASNQPLPDFVEFDASRPAASPAQAHCAMEPECYEGMRIRIASGTVLSGSQYFGSDNVAEMYIRPGAGRAFREPGVRYPGVTNRPTTPVWDGNPEVFELDPDKLGLENVSWAPGATFSAAGVLGYEFGGYELWATELRARTGGITLPQPVRAKAQGEVTVASLNLLNLRQNSADLRYQKLSLYIREVLGSPDVVGVQEVYLQAALAKLATRITTDDSNVVYTAHVVQTANSQAVGFLVRSGVTVKGGGPTEHGAGETFVDPRDNSNDPVHDRLPLMLEASVGSFAFTVIDVHTRSLIGVDDAARGGWIRAKRLAQAQSVARLVQQQNDAGAKVIVVGDFNAYEFTDGYVDVVGQIKGSLKPSRNLLSGPDLVNPNLCNLVDGLPAADRYSLLFEGTAQALDHALVNQPMSRHAVEMEYGRGNADAAGVERNSANALASSDHDGLVVYLSTTDRGRSNCPVGLEDGPDGGGGLPPPGGDPDPLPTGPADLSLGASSRIVSGARTEIRVEVENDGPGPATNVVVRSSLTASGLSLDFVTSGCAEDPNGVPECGLGDIAAGDSASFRITVKTDVASESVLRYAGSVVSDVTDPTPGNDEDTVRLPLGPPNAPTDLTATAVGATRIELRWSDNSNAETGFAVYQQGPGDSRPRLIGMAPANATSTIVTDLVPGIAYRFAVEARNGALASERTATVAATTWFSEEARCDQGDVLCLGSFEVEVEWDAGDGRSGRGVAERLTVRSGDFWFFGSNNVEMVVKVLDGCALNGHMWVFAAGLTDVGVTTTVRDLSTGKERQWSNPLGTPFEPILDKEAFASCVAPFSVAAADTTVLSGAALGVLSETRQSGSVAAAASFPIWRDDANRVAATGDAASDAACVASETALCLQDDRYRVSADWRVGEQGGMAKGFQRTPDTGMFWFFGPDNVELIVKVLDGCAVNGHRWVLMGGLTDVVVDVSVTDSVTGEARMYGSPGGAPFQPMFDLEAFSCNAGP